MKKIFITSFFAFIALMSFAKKDAQVQLIHNIGFEGNQEVDIWLTTPMSSEKLIDNFTFRTSTSFLNIISNTDVVLSMADANSSSIFDTLPGYSYTFNFSQNERYVLVAESKTDQVGIETKNFEFKVYATGKTFIEKDGYADVLIHHGKKNFITLSIDSENEEDLTKKIYKNQVLGYLKLPIANYTIQARNTINLPDAVSKSFRLNPIELNENNAPIVIVASGYVDDLFDFPDYDFGVYAVLPDGGDWIELETFDDDPNFTEFNLVIEPNPANRYIKIPVLQDRITSLSLFNISGIMVKNLKDVKDDILDLSFLPEGAYELVITTESKRISYQKIWKI